MSLLQLKNASIILGHPPLLNGIELVIHPGERLCLVGRNGCGKSTLLRVIEADIKLDDGQRLINREVKVSRLPQDPPASVQCSLFDYVAEGLAEVGEYLKGYFHTADLVAEDPSDANMAKLEFFQQQLDHHNGWQLEQRIQQVLTKLQLDPNQQLSNLSGGWRRKAALAKAMASEPDILLLDEPTNHLDIDMIKWLEDAIMGYSGAVVFVSHDRAFIRRVASRIIDLDRGNLVSYPGNYQAYLDQKAHDLEVEEAQNALFDKKLSIEEAWIRQGVKARRTRNEGRVRALKALRTERSLRANKLGTAKVSVSESKSSGKIVFETENLHYSIADKLIVESLTTTILRGEKLALVGPNGCGKSTLIKLLLGQLSPTSGVVKSGSKLEVAYFDQHRDQLDGELKVIDAIADGRREVTLNGKTKHVMSYLQDYLFTPERVNSPVKSLSGGEKNRLLLAKLMLKPSNILILDEPTNDLDVETLELLEDTICSYPGTVILVSHDREFVDNVVTSSYFFEGKGKIREFVGGCTDISNWYAQHRSQKVTKVATKPQTQSPKNISAEVKAKKLSYKLQLELESLPLKIESLENQIENLQQLVNSPDFFSQGAEKSDPVLAELAETEKLLNQSYERWDEIEALNE
ncbi:ATP-binding cassette ATPase Uup [Paraglaciecola arctica]|uniref:ATP-binding cassette ATPase Uup n=1 Tax=Paraglaciecola arctica TaxID=1128911 RepID=UPI001C07ACB3|nr:ABC transporter ATP-binding protein [Paraglaciecola arctica]MBU3002801.1 ABC transporter ATP-binding protein [Paraglaciecola arctica]